MADAAPGAEFRFIAHLPEWGLDFPVEDPVWDGGLPTAAPATGSTVWGAVFSVPDEDLDGLNAVENAEQRVARTIEAIDRNGKRHQVTVHLCDDNGNGTFPPSARYLEVMLAGSRHWSLPAGWIAGLEEYLQAT